MRLAVMLMFASVAIARADDLDVDIEGRALRKGASEAIAAFVRERGGAVPAGFAEAADRIARTGGTPLAVADGRRMLANMEVIRNEPSCHEAGCHYHQPTQAVLGVVDIVYSLEAIDRKVAGEQVVAVPGEQPREKIIDLVAALKQSLAERGAQAEAAPPRKAARKSTGKKTSAKKSSKRESG